MRIDPLPIVKIAIKASNKVMSYYKSKSFETTRKNDNSMVTSADLASSQLIIKSLKKLYPDFPVVSEEENLKINTNIIKENSLFWLIDPIDGTWSFINRSGDFVINIALIKDGYPIFGVISAPLRQAVYFNHNNEVYKLQSAKLVKISPNKTFSKGLDFLVSDSNINQRTQDFISNFKVKTLTPISSAFKFALMVEGKGDIYPRFKRTYIWDTAAGHALLRATGGDVYDMNYKALKYNQQLVNPDFVAVVNTDIISEAKLNINQQLS